MLLDKLEDAEVEIYSVGKIFDVFLGRGIRDHVKTKSNADGMAQDGPTRSVNWSAG